MHLELFAMLVQQVLFGFGGKWRLCHDKETKILSTICLLKEIGRKSKLRRILYLVQVQITSTIKIKIDRQNKLSDGGAMVFTSDFSVRNK